MPIQNIFNTTGRGNVITTASTNFATSQSSPYTNGLNQTFYRAVVSGSTRQDLVPFGLQNLSNFEGVYLQGISAVTEIYPFSGWTNLQTFIVRDSKLAKFDITLPQDFGGAFYLQTNFRGSAAGSPGLYLYNNSDIGIFSPKYYNGSATTAYYLDFVGNRFTGMSIDVTEKQYWAFRFKDNLFCKFLNFSGYQGGDGGIYRRNTFQFTVEGNDALTGITFPNNSFTAYSINMSGGAANLWSDADGFLSVTDNRILSYFDSDLPVTSTRYRANFSKNKFSQWTPNFIYDQPYFLDLSSNVLTGISNTFQNWPLSHPKKFDNIWKTRNLATIGNREPTWPKSYTSYDKNKTKDEYYYFSATVTTIVSTSNTVIFNLQSPNDIRAVYIIPQSYGSGLNDENRGWTGFNFICDDNETEDILKFRGKYRLGLQKQPIDFNPNATSLTAVTFINLPSGTYSPSNGKVIFRSENGINLSLNNFTDLRNLNGQPFQTLPEPLHRFDISNNPQLTSFTPSLNSSLTLFDASNCAKLENFYGEVSGASQITYFNISKCKFSEWDKQFYTGITQFDCLPPASIFDAYWYPRNGYALQPFLNSFNTKKSIIGLNTSPPENMYVSTAVPAYYDIRWFYSRYAIFSNNFFTSFNLYKLSPFDFIYLNDNQLTEITQFSSHPYLKYIDLSSNKFVNSNSIIGDTETFPNSLKYLTLGHNRVSSPSTLTGWTKTFSGLTSSTGYTSDSITAATFFNAARTEFFNINNERLFLNFLGQYKLGYENENFESSFDFIVRDLCTAKTNGIYLSGGVLAVSGSVVTSTSTLLITESYSVENALTKYPSQYTGFTLTNGSQYVVSDYGYMKDWLDLLTGRTISETTGRGWVTNVNNSASPNSSALTNTQLYRMPEPQKCNELTNGTFNNDLSGWQSNSDWLWSPLYGGSAQYIGTNNVNSFPISQNILDINGVYRVVLFVNIGPSSTSNCVVYINAGTTTITKTFTSTGTFRVFETITCTENITFSISVKDENVTQGNIYINKVAVCGINRTLDIFQASRLLASPGTTINTLTNTLPTVSWSGNNWCVSNFTYSAKIANVVINDTNGFNALGWYLINVQVNVESGGSGRNDVNNGPIIQTGQGPRTASVFLGSGNTTSINNGTLGAVPDNKLSDYRVNIDGTNETYYYKFLMRMPLTPGTTPILLRTDNYNCFNGTFGSLGELIGFRGTIAVNILELDCDQCGYSPQLINTDNSICDRFKYNNSNLLLPGGIEFIGVVNAWTSIRLNRNSFDNFSFNDSVLDTPPPVSPRWRYQIYLTDGTYYWIYRVTTTQNDDVNTITLNSTYPVGTNSINNPTPTSLTPIYLSIIY